MIKKVKLLIVGVSGNCGGIETFFDGLFGNGSEKYDISFLTFSDKCAFEDKYIGLGYQIYHMKSRKDLMFKFNKTVKEFFEEHNDFDYIWVNTASTSMYQFQYFGKKLTRAKIITHSHGIKAENASKIRLFINKILSKINRNKVLKNTDLYVGCGKSAALALFGRKYKGKIIVINNGINVDLFKYSQQNRIDIRKEFGIDEEKFVIGMFGRIAPVKNPFKTIEVFQSYLKINNNAVMLFVGSGEMTDDVKNEVARMGLSNKVIFAGFRSDVYKFYSAVDCLLMPSFFEGLPLTAIEAQANGLMCLLSDSIPHDIEITELVQFMDLDEPSEKWAEKIEVMSSSLPNERKYYEQIIEDSIYNIEKVKELVNEVIA